RKPETKYESRPPSPIPFLTDPTSRDRRAVMRHQDSGWRPPSSSDEEGGHDRGVLELPPTYHDSTMRVGHSNEGAGSRMTGSSGGRPARSLPRPPEMQSMGGLLKS
ncbi:hypothetical protein V5O48_007310, partial [Marasmius crinis-equi]